MNAAVEWSPRIPREFDPGTHVHWFTMAPDGLLLHHVGRVLARIPGGHHPLDVMPRGMLQQRRLMISPEDPRRDLPSYVVTVWIDGIPYLYWPQTESLRPCYNGHGA